MSTRTVDVALGTSGLDARGRPITVPLGVQLQDTGEFEVPGHFDEAFGADVGEWAEAGPSHRGLQARKAAGRT